MWSISLSYGNALRDDRDDRDDTETPAMVTTIDLLASERRFGQFAYHLVDNKQTYYLIEIKLFPNRRYHQDFYLLSLAFRPSFSVF